MRKCYHVEENQKFTKHFGKFYIIFLSLDLRQKGTFVKIPGIAIKDYIKAFEENWADYEQLKLAIPNGGKFTKDGKLGMSIRIGSFAQGVCLRYYHMPISSKNSLNK